MGHSGFASRVITRKRNHQVHLDKGLCRVCSKKAIKNRTLCEYHSEYQKEQYRRRKALNVQEASP